MHSLTAIISTTNKQQRAGRFYHHNTSRCSLIIRLALFTIMIVICGVTTTTATTTSSSPTSSIVIPSNDDQQQQNANAGPIVAKNLDNDLAVVPAQQTITENNADNDDDLNNSVIRYMSIYPPFVTNVAKSDARRQLRNNNINSNNNNNNNDLFQQQQQQLQLQQQQQQDSTRFWSDLSHYLPKASMWKMQPPMKQQQPNLAPSTKQQFTYGSNQRLNNQEQAMHYSDDHDNYEQLAASIDQQHQQRQFGPPASNTIDTVVLALGREGQNLPDGVVPAAIDDQGYDQATIILRPGNIVASQRPTRFKPPTSNTYLGGRFQNGDESHQSAISSKRANLIKSDTYSGGTNYPFTLGKRPAKIMRYGESPASATSPVGKRPSGHRYDFGLGKRAPNQRFDSERRPYFSKVRYDYGLGK